MHDMLVNLYGLPALQEATDAAAKHGVTIRRALAPEKDLLVAWVQANFPVVAAEVGIACCRLPVSCFIALRGQQILGFACYDTAARNFFGPEAVLAAERGRGLGRALLLAVLHAQREQGYAYAIIGGVGPAEFYARSVGAIAIAGSSPGIYAGMLRPPATTED
ncbi:MAG: GNAT family N-acetyltransferase [Betaproteobacteria bacterium]